METKTFFKISKQYNMIMSKLMIFFGWTIPLNQLYLPLAFKEWWKSPIFRRKPGGCWIFMYRLLMPDANHGQCFALDTGPRANRQAPHHLIHSNPATLHTPGASPRSCHRSSPLLIPLPFLHPPSIHTRGSLLPHCPVLSHIPQVCTQSRIVCVSYRAHSQGSFRTNIHPTGCVHSRTDEFTHIHIFLHKTNRHAFMSAHDHKCTHWFSYVHTAYTLICIHRMSHTEIPVSVFLLLCFHSLFAVWSFNPLSITHFLFSSVPTLG